jgi:methionine-R-sulfoxide reductase
MCHASALVMGLALASAPAAAQSHAKGWNPMEFKKPSDAELRRSLTPEQYQITQHEGTERPFHNTYWDNHRPGIYVDVVSGEPLFSSLDKFESGTGWPSFTRPLAPENVHDKKDRSLGMARTEVRSVHANSRPGHVFVAGPPTECAIHDSAALRFIPVDARRTRVRAIPAPVQGSRRGLDAPVTTGRTALGASRAGVVSALVFLGMHRRVRSASPPLRWAKPTRPLRRCGFPRPCTRASPHRPPPRVHATVRRAPNHHLGGLPWSRRRRHSYCSVPAFSSAPATVSGARCCKTTPSAPWPMASCMWPRRSRARRTWWRGA